MPPRIPPYFGGAGSANRAAIANRYLLGTSSQDVGARNIRMPTGPTELALPEGVQQYTPGDPPLWSTIQEKLQGILESPPEYFTGQQLSPEEEAANRAWESMHAPNVLSQRIGSKAGIEQARIRAEAMAEDRKLMRETRDEEKKAQQNYKEYTHAVNLHEKRVTALNKALTDQKGAYSKETIDTLREQVNASARAIHKTKYAEEIAGIEELYPELSESNLPIYLEKMRQVGQLKEMREQDVAGAQYMSEAGLPDIFGSPPAAYNALQELTARMNELPPEQAKQLADKIKNASPADKGPAARLAVAKQIIEEDTAKGTISPVLLDFFRELMSVQQPQPEMAFQPQPGYGGRLGGAMPGPEQDPMGIQPQLGGEEQTSAIRDMLSRLSVTAEETPYRQQYRGARRAARPTGRITRGAHPYTPMMESFRRNRELGVR